LRNIVPEKNHINFGGLRRDRQINQNKKL